jgi:D-alanyl-D-alanine carboxypeptidase
LLAGTALILPACGTGKPSEHERASEPLRRPSVVVNDAQLRQRLDEFVAASAAPVVALSVQHGHEPPHVLVADNGGVGAPARRDTRFRIGSVSKVFIGAVILTLVRDGKLALDDHLATYEPEVVGADRITIADLLHHTSGLAPEGGEARTPYSDAWSKFTLARRTRTVTSAEVVKFVRDRPLLFEPGRSEQYSNINAILLGRIAEHVTGLPLHQVLRRRVLDPLHLDHTALWPNDPTGPMPDEGVLLLNGRRFSTNQIPMLGTLSAIGAAGSMVSTIDDIAAFGSAYLRDHKPLPGDIARDAFTLNRFGTGSGILGFTFYGACGLRPGGCPNDTTFFARGGLGNVPGGSSVVFYDPRADVVVALLTNQEGAPTGELASVIVDNLLGGVGRTISATVVDAQTGMPLEGATATEHAEHARFMTTGPDGHFMLLGVAPTAIIRIERPGYQPIERTAAAISSTLEMHAAPDG